MATYESLAEMEATTKKMEAEPYFQALLTEGGELGLFNAVTDGIYESLF